MPLVFGSAEEGHIGLSNSVVGVANSTQEPLSECLTSSITCEEVIEYGGVEGS